jgi:hypothetical protein
VIKPFGGSGFDAPFSWACDGDTAILAMVIATTPAIKALFHLERTGLINPPAKSLLFFSTASGRGAPLKSV